MVGWANTMEPVTSRSSGTSMRNGWTSSFLTCLALVCSSRGWAMWCKWQQWASSLCRRCKEAARCKRRLRSQVMWSVNTFSLELEYCETDQERVWLWATSSRTLGFWQLKRKAQSDLPPHPRLRRWWPTAAQRTPEDVFPSWICRARTLMAGSAEQRGCRIQCLESREEESCRNHVAKAAPARTDQTEMSTDLNDPSQPPQQPHRGRISSDYLRDV